MDSVKKHYEKIILSGVLLGLVGFLVFLPFVISSDRQKQLDLFKSITNPKVTALPPLDLSRQNETAERLQSSLSFDFSTTNRVFNPMEWKRAADGNIFKIKTGNEIGASAATVTKITPLYTVVSFDSVETNGLAPRYVIGVEHQSAYNPALRRKQQRYASVGEKKDFFTFLAVKGSPEDPTAVVLRLADTDETVTVSKDKPYQHVDTYAADLKYDPEKKNFPGRRIGSPLSFGGADYIIVAIDADEVILSAQSNQKKTTLRYTPDK
jgi:hypothetical protein